MPRDPLVNAMTNRMFPELQRFEDTRRDAAFQRAVRNSRTRVLGAVIIVVALPVMYGVIHVLHPLLSQVCPEVVATLLLPFGLTISCIWLIWRVTRRSIQRSLRLQLQEQGVRLCLECGYDLQGLSLLRCPECATPFVPPRSDPPE